MNVLGFAFAVLLIELTPGPNMAWLAAVAAVHGRRTGVAAVCGIAIGLVVNAILAAIGLFAIVRAFPQTWTWLRLAGAMMMVLLAVGTWRDADKPLSDMTSKQTMLRTVGTGMMINLLNPKAYIFFVVVAPRFIGSRDFGLGEALVLSAISVSIASFIHVLVVVAGSAAHRWLRDHRRMRDVRRAFALVILGVAASYIVV